MHAKQCRDGDIAGRFIDTVSLLGGIGCTVHNPEDLLSALMHNNTVTQTEWDKVKWKGGIQVFREAEMQQCKSTVDGNYDMLQYHGLIKDVTLIVTYTKVK